MSLETKLLMYDLKSSFLCLYLSSKQIQMAETGESKKEETDYKRLHSFPLIRVCIHFYCNPTQPVIKCPVFHSVCGNIYQVVLKLCHANTNCIMEGGKKKEQRRVKQLSDKQSVLSMLTGFVAFC